MISYRYITDAYLSGDNFPLYQGLRDGNISASETAEFVSVGASEFHLGLGLLVLRENPVFPLLVLEDPGFRVAAEAYLGALFLVRRHQTTPTEEEITEVTRELKQYEIVSWGRYATEKGWIKCRICGPDLEHPNITGSLRETRNIMVEFSEQHYAFHIVESVGLFSLAKEQ